MLDSIDMYNFSFSIDFHHCWTFHLYHFPSHQGCSLHIVGTDNHTSSCGVKEQLVDDLS